MLVKKYWVWLFLAVLAADTFVLVIRHVNAHVFFEDPADANTDGWATSGKEKPSRKKLAGHSWRTRNGLGR